MSLIYGILEAEGGTANRTRLTELGNASRATHHDAHFFGLGGRIGMGHELRRTHQRSWLINAVFSDAQHNLVAFEGRLDNHAELSEWLGLIDEDVSDAEIVAATYRRLGEECFSKLTGDWALALWSYATQTLYLARDHAGIRPLYFWEDHGTLLWSSCIPSGPDIQSTNRICLNFARAYLAGTRLGNHTPYKNIKAVPPGHYLRVGRGRHSFATHWRPLAEQALALGSEAAYEERFLSLLTQAVRRRTVSSSYPIAAELSGGMDSSSIVCIADRITALYPKQAPPVKTISYFDDAEPNWDERPYVRVVENERKIEGIHVAVAMDAEKFEACPKDFATPTWPGTTFAAFQQRQQIERALREAGIRCVLSGIGGDELLGGVPYETPELADYLANGQFSTLFSQSVQWCLHGRRPMLFSLQETIRFVVKTYSGSGGSTYAVPPWLVGHSPGATQAKQWVTPSLSQRICTRPSAIANCFTWQTVVETVGTNAGRSSQEFDYAYPYLDKDLVTFLLSLPREQLVRPGRRRSLMRRALKEIVPVEILERRRKAYAIRGPLRSLQDSADTLRELFARPLLEELGLIDRKTLLSCMEEVISGRNTIWWPSLTRTAMYEIWLQSLFPASVARFSSSAPEQLLLSSPA
ncbi:MAG: asparagine synthase-related protein [Acidobacteriaceae bacterium]|nr:asparagine synthase-related protein [Acidobacteriaceae bacterium]